MEEDNTGKKGEGESSNEESRKLTNDEIYKLKEQEYLAELNANPKYLEVFDNYSPFTLDSFKVLYAAIKANVFLYGENYLKCEEDYATRYYKAAQKRFRDIQQKKLFDLQCRWRAEEIKIPEIGTTGDFRLWEEDVLICPFLTPVAQHEFDLYIDFISETSDYEKIADVDTWQDYDDFKAWQKDDAEKAWRGRRYPEWYKFHDSRTGKNYMKQLPDIRGEKEEFYMNIMREKWKKEREEKEKNNPQKEEEKLKNLYPSGEDLEKFMELFEDGKLLRLHKARDRSEEMEEDYDLNEAIETLQISEENVEINFNEDWRQGIIEAASGCMRKRLIEELKRFYKDYLFRLSIGLSLEDDPNRYKLGFYIARNLKDDILEAREINGEPRDLNF